MPGGRPNNYGVPGLSKISNKFFKWLDQLDDCDTAALADYTGGPYWTLNDGLRSGGNNVTDDLQARIDAIRLAASKLTWWNRYEGTVYRATMMTPEMLKELRPGKVFIDKAFLSTSLDDEIPLEFDMNVFFFITSKTGVDVCRYSEKPREREILFQPGTKFRVKWFGHVEDRPYPVCFMEEILEGEILDDDGEQHADDDNKKESRRSRQLEAKG